MKRKDKNTQLKFWSWNVFAIIAIGLILLNFNTSCKKSNLLSKGNLAFSKDTVVFDTVFTTIGSTTQQLKIYNKESRSVLIEEVQLMGGSNSPYRINLDGLSGTQFSALELEGKDSLFLFVEVTLDPNGGNLPMVVEDSIRFRTNGKDQYIILAAWGQDMYYHYSNLSGDAIDWDTNEGVWPNDKPHLIYGAAFIDEGKTLTIPEKTKIYMHKNSFLYVYKGTLNIEGSLGNEVVIQGDRLEDDYDDVQGQYYGVYFNEAKPSTINYAIIKNGTTGVHIEKDGNNGSTPTVKITNTKIYNHASYGILNFAGGKVEVENSVISNNGYHAFINIAGAGFSFKHCTITGYATGQTQLPAMGISDFYKDNQNNFAVDFVGSVENCIIYGNQTSEVALNFDNLGTNTLNFSHCLIKMDTPSADANMYTNIAWNLSPEFKDTQLFDYEINSNSGAIGKGITSSIAVDIKNKPRANPPTVGAYEFE